MTDAIETAIFQFTFLIVNLKPEMNTALGLFANVFTFLIVNLKRIKFFNVPSDKHTFTFLIVNLKRYRGYKAVNRVIIYIPYS